MKNLLKKLHMMPNNQNSDVDSEGSSSKGNQRLSDVSSLLVENENKLFNSSSISGWLNSVTNRPNVKLEDRNEGIDSMSSEALDASIEADRAGDSQVEEEYQIQLALELSAREDPEAVQIEAVKQISLGSCPPHNTPAQVLAYRYWVTSNLTFFFDPCSL